MALIATLTDNFNDNSRDTGKWTDNSSSQILEQNAQLELTPKPNDTSSYSWDSVDTFDLTGSSISVKFASVSDTSINSSEVMLPRLYLDSNNHFKWSYYENVIHVEKTVSGSGSTPYQIAYNSTNHAYVRISESGGTISFDSSADGTNWTNCTTFANPFAITALTVQFVVGQWVSKATGPTFALDDINIVPSAPSAFTPRSMLLGMG